MLHLDPKGFWRCITLGITRFLKFFHRQVLYRTQNLGHWIPSRPQVKWGIHTLLKQSERANLNHWTIGDYSSPFK
jgi:hypothetical protein